MPLRRAAAVLLVAAFGTALLARREAEEPARLLALGRDLLASQKADEALATLERIEGDVARDEVAKEAAVLRVLAALRKKDGVDAARRATALLQAWPADEPWRGRVEGLLASAAEAVGDVRAAAEREQAFAARATADPEKARIAAVYFAWAERFGKGEPAPDAVRPAIPPDPKAAIDAYRRGLAVLGPATPRADHLLAIARHALTLGDGGQAVAAADEALKAWKAPGPNEPGKKPDAAPAWVAEAHLRRAEGFVKAGDVASARGALRTLLALPSAEETPFAAPAWTALGRTYVGDATSGALAQAKAAFAAALKLRPDGADAAAVRRLVAEACVAVGAHDQALAAFADVVAAAGAPVEDAAWARLKTAESLRALRRFDDARAALHEFLARHPAHPGVPEAQAALPACLWDKAVAALEEGRRDDALKTYAEFATAHPLDARAPAASLAIGAELRKAKEFDRARDAYRDARERWLTARPDAAADAGLLLGVTEEEDRRDLEAAAKAYRFVVESLGGQRAANEARARLARLEAIELALASPRVFGAHEEAAAELTVRNVKETAVRIYRLDAASYFERKATLRGAEDLDVALVKADRAWRHATPSYARYRSDKLKVPLGQGGAALGEGAYLVVAEAENRRATVLVIVSKIRLVVKSAPTEIFAWALDAATGEPREGVDVLVRGAGLKTSALTGPDGTARVAVKPEHGVCEVLGRLGASAAPGLAVAAGAPTKEALLPRAHWTFDRPVYRPGEEVRYALVVRDVAAGVFVAPEGAAVETSWFDPRGKLVASAAAKVGPYGRTDGAFALPADGALGEWTLRAILRPTDPSMQVFEERVVVRAFRKPEFKVSVKPAKATVRPGDRCEVALGVESFFGGAAARVDYRWRVYRRAAEFDAGRYRSAAWFYKAVEKTAEPKPDPTWEFVVEGVGATDEKGAATFAFDALNLVAPQQYLVQASVTDVAKQWATGSGSVFASWTPGNVVVLPDRKAYRAGDRVTARVVAVDWSGAPLAVKGKVEALRMRTDGGRRIEEPAGATPLDLGLAGSAEAKLDAPRAGRLLLRFTGEDAAGLKVVGEAEADVAGERPDLAKETKIVFEREVYGAGEKARLFVDVPVAPAIGLLAFEGESVLLHRIVRVTERSSVVEVELPELLAPNVVATWCVPRADGLATSEDPVVVLRHLDVEVRPSADVARPGEKVKLVVTTKDQAGKPTPAAVTLAMTDAALQGLGGVGVQDPRFTFNRDVRPHLVRTGSTFAFKQAAAARALDADLVALDEQAARLKQAAELSTLAGRARVEGTHNGPPAAAPTPSEAGPGAPQDAIGLGGGSAGAFGGRRGGKIVSRQGGGVKKTEAKDADRNAEADYKNKAPSGEVAEESAADDDVSLMFDAVADPGAWGEGKAQDFAKLLRAVEAQRKALGEAEKADAFFVRMLASEGDGAATAYSLALDPGMLGGFSSALGAVFTPAPVETRERLLDTAAWEPRLVTDSNGRAEIEVALPDNLTVWSVDAAAVGAGVAGGLGAASVRVRKDVVVRVSLPTYLSVGDETTAVVVGSHLGAEAARMKLTLRAEGGREAVVEGASEIEREAPPRGAAGFDVRVKATAVGAATFAGSAATAAAGDGVKQGLRVLPFGEPWRFAERRALRDRAAIAFTVPEALLPGATSGRVIVQSGLAAELLEGLAFLGAYPHPILEATLNRVVAAAIVHRVLVDAGAPSPLREADVARGVERLWTTLRGYQNDDGGFASWPGRPSEPEATALVLESLVRLRAVGRLAAGDLLASATTGAGNLLRQGKPTRDQRAALVAALTAAGVDHTVDLNALARERDGLATASLARLVTAVVVAGRGALKADLLEALRARRRPDAAPFPFAGTPRDLWLGDDQETTALVLAAYQAADARVEEQLALVEALRAGWRLRGCVHTRATAATVAALARHATGAGATALAGDVVVALDGMPLPAAKVSGAEPRAVIELDPAALGPGRHEIVATRSGGGELDLRVVVASTAPAESVPAAAGFFDVARRILPYEDPDRPETSYAPGWSIVEETKRPAYEPPPPLAQAVAGSRVTVRLAVRARDDAHAVVLEDPLPAGLDVVESGVRGAFARYERRTDRMIFVFDRLRKGQEIVVTYPAYATLPGRYRAAPAEAVEMYAPELRGRSASAAFEIVDDAARLARVAPPVPTPDARLAGARDAFARGDYERVLALAGDLPTAFVLVDAAFDEAQSLVLVAALRLGRHAEAVKARDALLLRNPRAAGPPAEDVPRLGAAYLAVGDVERAREQFQWTADRAFEVEVGAAAFLDGVGRPADGAARREEALRRFPARGAAPETELALAGSYLALRDPSVTQESALPLQQMRWADALVAYQRVTAWHPKSELAERAGLERLRVRQGLGLPLRVQEEARAFAARYPAAPALDEVLYAEAVASFALGKLDEAKAPAEAVRTRRFPAHRGEEPPTRRSALAESAAYLLGKVAHVEGRLEDAVRLYGEAAPRVPEAADSHRFFVDKELATEPVVRVASGTGATLPIRVKNVAKATVQLYPVDLGVLFATRKSLRELNRADLSGIAPARTIDVTTGAKPYVAATVAASLTGTPAGGSAPAALADGAYLAVVTDGERTASTVVLAGDLELVVQTGGDGSARCYLTDGKGLPVAGARITLGQDGAVWYGGETDERGMILVRLRSNGRATVVAEKGDRYAAAER